MRIVHHKRWLTRLWDAASEPKQHTATAREFGPHNTKPPLAELYEQLLAAPCPSCGMTKARHACRCRLG